MKIKFVKDKNKNGEPDVIDIDFYVKRIAYYRIPATPTPGKYTPGIRQKDRGAYVTDAIKSYKKHGRYSGVQNYCERIWDYAILYRHDIGFVSDDGNRKIFNSMIPYERGGAVTVEVFAKINVTYEKLPNNSYVTGGSTWIGESYCSIMDNFSHKTGRMLALAHALWKVCPVERSDKFWTNISRTIVGDKDTPGLLMWRELSENAVNTDMVVINADNGSVSIECIYPNALRA